MLHILDVGDLPIRIHWLFALPLLVMPWVRITITLGKDRRP